MQPELVALAVMQGKLVGKCSIDIGSMARTKECAVPGVLDVGRASDWRDLLESFSTV